MAMRRRRCVTPAALPAPTPQSPLPDVKPVAAALAHPLPHSVAPTGQHAASGVVPVTDAPPDAAAKRWLDWNVRWLSGLAMIGAFIVYLYVGRQLGVALLVFVIQTLIYREVMLVAQVASREQQMPGFRLFYVWWFAVSAFFLYTRTLGPHVLRFLDQVAPLATPPQMTAEEATGELETLADGAPVPAGVPPVDPSLAAVALGVRWLVDKCAPIAFAAYIASLIAFVLSLRAQKHFRYQFSQFAYAHVAIMLIVGQSTFLVASAFEGLIWFVLPCSLVIANDSFAYIFGFLLGRTPLIRLSPKKTVEGFVGGAAMTFVMGWLLTRAFTRLEWGGINHLMVCPATQRMGMDIHMCDITKAAGGIFAPHPLGEWWFGSALPHWLASWHVTEMQLHTAVLAALASMVAPFGGFFASGFKRALRIKDFGSVIPGHGGFTDRMDCQLVMGSVAHMYLVWALRVGLSTATAAIFASRIIRALPPAEVAEVARRLLAHLAAVNATLPAQP
jgi:phosphatidate cytidylyltransferase